MKIQIKNTPWLYLGACAAIVAAAFLLRIYKIGDEELWFDEAFSFHMITIAQWPEALLRDNNPPLYYVLLRPLVVIFGQTEVAIRMLSAVLSTLFVVALLWFGREIFDRCASLWTAAIAAVAPVQIYYAQEARAYALLMLLLLLAYAALWRALDSRKWQWWAGFCAFIALALYTHYFAFLGIVPTAVLVWLWPERKHKRTNWLGYGASIAFGILLFSPWLFSVFQVRERVAGVEWIQYMWRRTGPLLAIPKSLEVFTLGSQKGFTSVINVKRFGDITFPVWLRLTGLAAALLLGICAAIPRGDKQLSVPWLKNHKVWLWTLLLFPLVALCLISFYKPVYAVGRYEIVAFPAFALLLGLAFTKIQSIEKIGPILASLVAIAFFVPIGVKLAAYYSGPLEPFARPTALSLHQMVRNQDALVISRPRDKTTIYYLTRLGYRWADGRCRDDAGHAFSCWVFPPDSPRKRTANADRRSSAEAFKEHVQEYIRALDPADGTLWMVIDGDILSNGRLKVRPPESYLVAALEKSGLNPVPVDPDLGIVQFRRQ